jgi:hypothetical protein
VWVGEPGGGFVRFGVAKEEGFAIGTYQRRASAGGW